jgi:hypothetical protein
MAGPFLPGGFPLAENGKGNNGKASFWYRLVQSPTVLVFLLTMVGAIIGWAVRQELVNRSQQQQLDAIMNPVSLSERLTRMQTHIDLMEQQLIRADRERSQIIQQIQPRDGQQPQR